MSQTSDYAAIRSRALAIAKAHRHTFVTKEHLLLSLIENQDASEVMQACNVDLERLRAELAEYIDEHLTPLPDGTGAFRPELDDVCQRLFQRVPGIAAQISESSLPTGAHILIGLFDEPGGVASNLLEAQNVTRSNIVRIVSAKRTTNVSSGLVARGLPQRAGDRTKPAALADEAAPDTMLIEFGQAVNALSQGWLRPDVRRDMRELLAKHGLGNED